jgi:uncharacterized protein YxjI
VRYSLKQKLFALGDDFYIRDENENNVFFVDGKFLSIGDQLSFQDLNGNELAFIKQKVLAWGRTYEIFRSGECVAVVKKEMFSPFHHTFYVDVPGPDDLKAEGDFFDMEYTFTRGDKIVARVSKQWFALGDTYGVQVDGGEDAILILASAVVVDMSCHGDGKRR